MALVTCVFCQAQISDRATHCPKCGIGWCRECGSLRSLDVLTCTECGFPFEPQRPRSNRRQVARKPTGLCRAYWINGLVVFGGSQLLAGSMVAGSPRLLVMVAGVFSAAWFLLVMPRIWEAANRYRGRQLWPYWAKVTTILGSIGQVGIVMVAALLLARVNAGWTPGDRAQADDEGVSIFGLSLSDQE